MQMHCAWLDGRLTKLDDIDIRNYRPAISSPDDFGESAHPKRPSNERATAVEYYR